MEVLRYEQFYDSVMKVLDNGLVRVKWEVDNTQSLVAPSDFQIDQAAKNGPLPESYLQVQTGRKRRKTRELPALNKNNSLTVNDAIDALSNSGLVLIFFIYPSDGISMNMKIQQMKKILNFIIYLEGELLAQCELHVATTENDEMVVIGQVEKLEIMSSSNKMSLLPSTVNCVG